MTRTSTSCRAGLFAWEAESVRLTTFHVPEALANLEEGWWRLVANAEPESTIVKKNLGERADVGTFADSQLSLQVQSKAGRVDWQMTDSTTLELVDAHENSRLEKRIDTLINGLQPWLRICPRTWRIALGIIGLLPVNGHEEGYKTISNYLEFDLDPKSFEFMYKINRPRPSTVVPKFTINRLMKWSVSLRKTVTMPEFIPIMLDSGSSFCRIELDINTHPISSDEAISPENLISLLNEFSMLAKEIVREGDIP